MAMRMVAALGLLVILGGRPPATPSSGIDLPERLKDYRTWRTDSPEPRSVSYDLWRLCVHPSREQEARAAKERGPHDKLQIQVFTNPAASAMFYSASAGQFPEGSIVVKEKSLAGTKSPVAIAAMVKGAVGSNPTSGDWEFLYVSAQGAAVATAVCRDCHRAAPSDFLFRSYRSGVSR
jgi:hypothetical protein